MDRKARRESCKVFLRRAGSLPEAMELARKEGFSQNTSVWLGALAEMLRDGETKPQKL